MKTLNTYPIYDLSSPHFANMEIITNRGEILRGQMVQFKVVKGVVEYLYPAEKYCFLPKVNAKTFWNNYNTTNGEFKEFPPYIKLLSLNEIQSIRIEPELVI